MFRGKRGAAKCFIVQLPPEKSSAGHERCPRFAFYRREAVFFQFLPINSRYAVRSDDHTETGRFFHPN